MSKFNRDSALELIQLNINKAGHHIYFVAGGSAAPRFAYTIGVSEKVGVELIFAGALFYSAEEVGRVINMVAADLKKQINERRSNIRLDLLGSFSLRSVDPSWASAMMLGAFDFYGKREIPAIQIFPNDDRWTIDVPDLSQPWSPKVEPVWQWLREQWRFPVPMTSTATTNLAALRGERVTEAARWEEDQWELFAGAGPDVPPEEIRVAPLGTMLAVDPSLSAATELTVGQAIWRDSTELEWHAWGESI